MRWFTAPALISLLATATAPAAFADHHIKPHSDGPISGGDFLGTVPDNPPYDGQVATFIDSNRPDTANGEEGDISSTAKVSNGKLVVESSVDAPTVSAKMDREQSWMKDDAKSDTQLLDHEQGHLDIAEVEARKLQAEYNEMEKNGQLKRSEEIDIPAGATQAEIQKLADDAMAKQSAELDAALNDAADRADTRMKQAQDTYDTETDHNRNTDQQNSWREQINKNLKPATDDANKVGASAGSRSDHSITFDAALGLLTLDQDFITAFTDTGPDFVADPNDPMLGAEMLLPVFELVGQSYSGDFYFQALGPDPEMRIVSLAGDTLFSTTVTELLYDSTLNTFMALGWDFDLASGSAFLDNLGGALASGTTLPSLTFTPDDDFMALSAAFQQSGGSGFTNGFGAISVAPVPVPPGVVLLASALGLTLFGRRRRAVAG